MSKPDLIVDFDGVIHSYLSGWKGAEIIEDPPVAGAGKALTEYVKWFNVHVFSSRSHQDGGITAMYYYCREWFGEEVANQLNFPTTKPPGVMTIDDRGFCFEGRFPSVDFIRNFKPWNKR